jgi:two-component system phosphate regulon sensor histidine kinase PhoR
VSATPIQPERPLRARLASPFWKLFAVYTAICLAAILVLGLLFSKAYEGSLTRDFDSRLLAAAATAKELLPAEWPEEPDERLQTLVREVGEHTNLRLTLIARDGKVLADSAQESLDDVRSMENHAGRPEFIEAMRTGSGSGDARRTSPSIGQRQRYVALRAGGVDQPLGVVRASLPTSAIDLEAMSLNRWVVAIGLLTALAATLLTAFATAQATKPLGELAAASSALLAGDYGRRLPVQSRWGDEFAVVGRALAEASQRLARGEHQLRSTSQTQATVLEGMSESVIAVDRREHVLFANASAGRLLGFRPEHVEDLPLLEAVRSHEIRDVVHRALRTGQLATCEWVRRAASPRTFDVLATPLPGNPPPGVVLVLRDVSEVKRLERMRQQFVANVSHELKTPLSSIKAYTETLLGGAKSDPVHCERFLRRIDEQAARLQDLIMDMLSLARIESGQAALDIADVSVARVVRRCLADNEPQAVARELVLENLVDDSDLRVHADEEGLRQILNNLIDNAIKYTPSGGKVTVRCQPEGRMATIDVTDTGIGIPAEHHAHLFERFYRVDKARSREVGGTGLGLSIVKHLCQTMGGSVSVRSELKKGSTFSVQLPLAGG